MRSTYRFSLDMHEVQSQLCLMATQGDTMRQFVINLCEGGEPFKIDADDISLIQLLIERPDKTVVAEWGDGNPALSADGTEVTYKFTKDTCPYEGMHDCKLVFWGKNDDEVLWSPSFSIFAGKKKEGQMTSR